MQSHDARSEVVSQKKRRACNRGVGRPRRLRDQLQCLTRMLTVSPSNQTSPIALSLPFLLLTTASNASAVRANLPRSPNRFSHSLNPSADWLSARDADDADGEIGGVGYGETSGSRRRDEDAVTRYAHDATMCSGRFG